MLFKIKLCGEHGLVGINHNDEVFIINTGLSFTGKTENGEICSIICPLRVDCLKDKINYPLIISGNKVLDLQNTWIEPDDIWLVSKFTRYPNLT
ncbi:hypothetical protein [Pectobacterium polaris]|uniref:hypothetical protein n=1 Tax=Pectobacterium polaris TaxID=2042057 RepID=UPI000F8EFD81|nr:hypothetical protein [Pectobacterium polaris]RUS02760.1 hypothetical protein KHDHEBDM_00471 [Pectobacterium polaris]